MTKRVRAGRVVGVEQRPDRVAFEVGAGDGVGDAVAGHFGEGFEHQLRRICVPLALEALVEPFSRDRPQPAEERCGGLAGVAPLAVGQVAGQLINER